MILRGLSTFLVFFLLVLSFDNRAAWSKLQPFSKSVESRNLESDLLRRSHGSAVS